MTPKVSIIIVHYKAVKELFRCLSSIEKSSPKTRYEVIVVDNDERKTIGKELKKKFTWVKYVRADGNVGYGAGVNLGAKKAKGEYILILNPDTEVFSGSIDKLVRFLDKNENVAIVAPNLVNRRGEVYPQLGSRTLTPLRGIFALSFLNNLFPNNPVSRSYFLTDKPLDKKREADAVPGSAMMIRKKVFDEVGGFDEKFFLYFEESDFCKRVRDLGHKIFISPKAEVIHLKGKSTPKSEKIKRIFAQSRFYYFKKHYGYFSAFFVEMFARFSKWHAALIAILVLGTFLRIFRIEENLIFHGELGYDYVTIKNFVLDGKVPLLGPPTSHAWFALGPLFYWIFSVVLPLGLYHPISGAYVMAFVGISATVISYFTIREFFGVRPALITAYLMAISPAWIRWTRRARFNLVAAVLFFPLFYFLTKNLQEKGKYLFWTGFFLGLSSHFFGGYIVLIAAVGLPLFLRRRDFKKDQIRSGLFGFLSL